MDEQKEEEPEVAAEESQEVAQASAAIVAEEPTKVDIPPESQDPPGRLTGVLISGVLMSCLGNGFIFGLQIGILNQPYKHIEAFVNETRNWEEDGLNFFMSGITSIWFMGCLVTSFYAGSIADKIGRKKGMYASCIFAILGGLVGNGTILAEMPELLVVSRLLGGIATALCIPTNTMYLSEIAPTNLRGAISTMFQLSITFGIFFISVLGIPDLLGTAELWDWLFGFICVPALACILGMSSLPESPRWLLVCRQDKENARKALVQLRGTDKVENELQEIQKAADSAKSVDAMTVMQVIKERALRMPLLIVFSLNMAQAFSGINAVMSYSSLIFALVGLPDSQVAYVVVAQNALNFVATFPTVPLMDRAGRRILLLSSTALALFSMCLLTAGLLAQGGEDTGGEAGPLGWLCVAGMLLYIVGFAIGLGPVNFVMMCEIFSDESRGAATSVAMVINWNANFLVVLLFPTLKKAMGVYVNVPFAFSLLAALVFFVIFIPETKGKTFDEIRRAMKKL